MKNIYDLFIGLSPDAAARALSEASECLDLFDKENGESRMAFMITALSFIADGGSVPQPFDDKEFHKLVDNYYIDNANSIIVIMESLLKQHRENKIKQGIKEKAEQLHKPLADGTTGEIANKLGISKSEVRKLKREGKLEERLRAV